MNYRELLANLAGVAALVVLFMSAWLATPL